MIKSSLLHFLKKCFLKLELASQACSSFSAIVLKHLQEILVQESFMILVCLLKC